MKIQPFSPASFASMTTSNRILLTALLDFGCSVFPEYAQLERKEKVNSVFSSRSRFFLEETSIRNPVRKLPIHVIETFNFRANDEMMITSLHAVELYQQRLIEFQWDIVVNNFYRFRLFEGIYRASQVYPDDMDVWVLHWCLIQAHQYQYGSHPISIPSVDHQQSGRHGSLVECLILLPSSEQLIRGSMQPTWSGIATTRTRLFDLVSKQIHSFSEPSPATLIGHQSSVWTNSVVMRQPATGRDWKSELFLPPCRVVTKFHPYILQ